MGGKDTWVRTFTVAPQVDLDVKLGGERGKGAVRLGRLRLGVADLPALQTALSPGAARGEAARPLSPGAVRGEAATSASRALIVHWAFFLVG